MTPEEQKDLHKEAIKEAIQEWLDQQYKMVGQWTMKGITAAAAVIGANCWFKCYPIGTNTVVSVGNWS